MTATEFAIMGFFRRYKILPEEMLFFNPADCKMSPGPFNTAMESLMRRGLVIKERPKQAYSLTRNGYDIARAIEVPVKPAPRTLAKAATKK
jgi:RIO-like serine/threonine protein kinase